MSPGILVDRERMLDLLGFEGQLLTTATHDAHPDSIVSGVSMRTLRETVRHAGDLCEDTLSWLDASGATRRDSGLPAHASLREVTSRFTARLADLLAEFGTRPAGDTCRTWWPEQQDVGFWVRRMLHATTVYRVDVQTAARVEMTPIDTDVALDGIDEVLEVWLGYRLGILGVTATHAFSVGIRAADRGWHVEMTQQRARVTRYQDVSVPDEDAVVSGDVSAVYLWLWGRLPDRSVRVTGDHDAVAQVWGLLRLATQ